MVFPGRFSTGCLRCRQRKIKCDENKPTCRRCDIYGKPCPGYTNNFHFRHSAKSGLGSGNHSFISSPSPDTSSSQLEARRDSLPGRKRTRGRDAVAPQAEVVLPVTSLYRMETSYEDSSLCYFVRRFTSPDIEDGFPGHFSFLPKLYNHHSPGLLEAATLSVAQMAAYNRFGGKEFRRLSYRSYGRAILLMQDALQSGKDSTDDKVITAVLLLCTLKDVSGEGFGDPNEHASGLFYLLENRGLDQITTKRGIELLLLALLRLQIYSFLHRDDSYCDPGALVTFLALFNPLIRAMAMMSNILVLRHKVLDFMDAQDRSQRNSHGSHNNTNSEDEQQDDLVKQCFKALDDFEQWDTEAAAFWKTSFGERAVPATAGDLDLGITHYDGETACTIILVRTARLILLLTLLFYFGKRQLLMRREQSPPEDESAGPACISVLGQHARKTIDEILSIVPYALGDLSSSGVPSSVEHDGAGALIIVQSVRLISYSGYTTSAQFEKSHQVLRRMNETMGIRSAMGWGREGFAGSAWVEEQAFLRLVSQMDFSEAAASNTSWDWLQHLFVV